MTDWWRALEEEIAQRGVDAPDPWASPDDTEQLALTADQRAFLEQVTNTPGQGLDDELGDQAENESA